MLSEKLRKSIKEVFLNKDIESQISKEKLLEMALSNYKTAQNKLFRRLLLFVLVWLFTVILSSGGEGELSLLGIKITDVRFPIQASPLILSFLFYSIAATFSFLNQVQWAIQEIFQDSWPNVETDLTYFFTPFSVITYESSLVPMSHSKWQRLFLVLWGLLLISLSVLGPLGAVVHTSIIAYKESVTEWGFICVLVLVIMNSIRAAFVIYNDIFKELKG